MVCGGGDNVASTLRKCGRKLETLPTRRPTWGRAAPRCACGSRERTYTRDGVAGVRREGGSQPAPPMGRKSDTPFCAESGAHAGGTAGEERRSGGLGDRGAGGWQWTERGVLKVDDSECRPENAVSLAHLHPRETK